MQEEIIVSLENPICLTVSGNENYYRELVIKAPTSKHQKHYSVLKSALLKALNNNEKNEKTNNDESKQSDDDNKSDAITGEQIVLLLMMADVDTDKLFDAFKGILFTQKTAMFDNVIEMNQLLYDKLSIADLERALGEYINVFILGSLKKAS